MSIPEETPAAAITAAQMGHRDPRMRLRVYTDVTGLRPQTRMGGLLGNADWALSGTEGGSAGGQGDETAAQTDLKPVNLQALR